MGVPSFTLKMWYMLAEIPDASCSSSINNLNSLQSLIGSKEIDLFKDGMLHPLELHNEKQEYLGTAKNGTNIKSFNHCQYCVINLKREKKLREKLKMLEDFIRKMNRKLEVDTIEITEVINSRAAKLEMTRQENVILHRTNNENSSKLVDCEKEIHHLRVQVSHLQTENSSLQEMLSMFYAERQQTGAFKRNQRITPNESQDDKGVKISSVKRRLDEKNWFQHELIDSPGFKDHDQGPLSASTPRKFPFIPTPHQTNESADSTNEGLSQDMDVGEFSGLSDRFFIASDPERTSIKDDIYKPTNDQNVMSHDDHFYQSVNKKKTIDDAYKPMECDLHDHTLCDETCYIMNLVKRASEVREQLTSVNDLVKNFAVTKTIAEISNENYK